MIANCKTISHGKAAAEYDEKKEVNDEHIATEIDRKGVYGLTASECIKEMQEVQEQCKHKLKNSFFRIEICPSKEEKAGEWDEDKWKSVIARYCAAMKIDNAQALWILHKKTDHDDELPHVHGIVNRIDMGGNVLSDKYCQIRSIEVINRMTEVMGYTTANDISRAERETIKSKAHEALRHLRQYDFVAYSNECERLGLVVTPNISTNGKRSGYYLSMKGSTKQWKASTIDRALTDGKITRTHYNERKQYERELRQQQERQQEQGRGIKLS